MVNPKYSHSVLESREFLKQAISFIGAHQLSANPVNYTVCYEYLLGTHPQLQQSMNETLAGNEPLNDQMMEHWFKTYLSEYELTNLQQSQTDLMEVMSALAEFTQQAEHDVTQFGDTLRHSEQELASANSSLESVVAHLLASTKSIQASMELMRTQIQESREEIQTLRDRLEKVSEEVLTDALTGLANRKGLTYAVEEALEAAKGKALQACVLMVDIDHFKAINDTYGHLLGDQVIKVVGDSLKNQIKGKDTAARYGGEEFCVLLPETQLQDAVKLAEGIREAIQQIKIKRKKAPEEICRVTVSVGVTSYHAKEPVTDFFERADQALYLSKNGGRNRVSTIK